MQVFDKKYDEEWSWFKSLKAGDLVTYTPSPDFPSEPVLLLEEPNFKWMPTTGSMYPAWVAKALFPDGSIGNVVYYPFSNLSPFTLSTEKKEEHGKP